MSTPTTTSPSALPDYIASATPNPTTNRAPWFKNTAPTYAGIFLWFVFWQDAVNKPSPGGGLAAGVGIALLGLVVAALICHFLFYFVPAMLGTKTGLPLYIVGTSTFGSLGGFLMPGFLMGVLQFGWLGVNTYFSSLAISQMVPIPPQIIMIAWGVLAALVGLKGIQYVASVSTYVPLIPLGILLLMLAKTIGGLGSFDPQNLIAAHQDVTLQPGMPMDAFGVIAFMLTYVVGFFATAGAAGVDFGMNNRDGRDVQYGGLVGIALATLVTAGLSTLIVAGTFGSPERSAKLVEMAKAESAKQVAAAEEAGKSSSTTLSAEARAEIASAAASNVMYRSTSLFETVVGSDLSKWLLLLLALAAFPPACFSSFIAANSFKTTLPSVNPLISVGIGAAVSIILAVTGLAGKVVPVFVIIGASFGPICGAMAVDYLLAGKRWSGPRAGFNPAGWIAWAAGFVVGILPNLRAFSPSIPDVPAAPVAAFIVGAVVYFICAKIGLLTPLVPMPNRIDAA
jgi:cytosine permease